MIVGKPYRFVSSAAVVFLLASAHLFAADLRFSRTSAQTPRTFQPDRQSSQGALFLRISSRALSRSSQPPRIRLFYPAIAPARLSTARPDGWYRVPHATGRDFGRHIPSGAGRSPPLFFL